MVTGGTPPFDFKWSNGSTSEDLTDVPPGDYTITVTDANDCEESKTFNVFRPAALEIDVLTNIIVDCDTKETFQVNSLEIIGGVAPYSINWSRGEVDPNTPQIMTTDENGVVIVDVLDALGCVRQLVYNVDFDLIGSPSFTLTSFGFEEYDTYSIDDPIFFTNTSTESPLEVEWNFGDKSETSNVFSPQHIYTNVGTYAVTLTTKYPYGCESSVTQEITITQGYNIILPTAFTPNEDGLNDTVRPVFFGLESIEMNVFNTWGELVYHEEGLGLRGWDGSLNGKPAENGNYVMSITGITFYGKEIKLIGPITLIR